MLLFVLNHSPSFSLCWLCNSLTTIKSVNREFILRNMHSDLSKAVNSCPAFLTPMQFPCPRKNREKISKRGECVCIPVWVCVCVSVARQVSRMCAWRFVVWVACDFSVPFIFLPHIILYVFHITHNILCIYLSFFFLFPLNQKRHVLQATNKILCAPIHPNLVSFMVSSSSTNSSWSFFAASFSVGVVAALVGVVVNCCCCCKLLLVLL